jgi:hypothetical protein
MPLHKAHTQHHRNQESIIQNVDDLLWPILQRNAHHVVLEPDVAVLCQGLSAYVVWLIRWLFYRSHLRLSCTSAALLEMLRFPLFLRK